MIHHKDLNPKDLFVLIRNTPALLAGNQNLKIYGTLQCASGKRIKKENRVFFNHETEALEHHYRPCGHCMKKAYQKWKTYSRK